MLEGGKDLGRSPVFPTTLDISLDTCSQRTIEQREVFKVSRDEEIPVDKQRVYKLMTARLIPEKLC
jgi:hypothetical protein